MTTVLQYLVIAAVIALVLFGLALLLFGRGEQMPPLAARTSPASLPAQQIEGDDVRSVKFSLAVRGYRMSDVDWTLDRLAEELDRTRERLRELETGTSEVLTGTSPDQPNPVEPETNAELVTGAHRAPDEDLFIGDPPPLPETSPPPESPPPESSPIESAANHSQSLQKISTEGERRI